MKKVGELMKELGFKEGASEQVQKAFIKNLIRQAYGVEVREPIETPQKTFEIKSNLAKAQSNIEKRTRAKSSGPASSEQLSFDLGPTSKKLA